MQSRDRAGSDELGLTQEFLARMLGVRRASVTRAAGMLQSADVIAYGRGYVNVLDVAALEAACCEYYALMRDEYSFVFR